MGEAQGVGQVAPQKEEDHPPPEEAQGAEEAVVLVRGGEAAQGGEESGPVPAQEPGHQEGEEGLEPRRHGSTIPKAPGPYSEGYGRPPA